MKKLLFALLLVVGSFMSQAQDHFDIVRYADANGNKFQAIIGEDGFSDCTDSSLTQTAKLRIANTSDTVVTVSIVGANDTLIPIATIANTPGLTVLFAIINGIGEFSKINNSGFNTDVAVIDGTSISFSNN